MSTRCIDDSIFSYDIIHTDIILIQWQPVDLLEGKCDTDLAQGRIFLKEPVIITGTVPDSPAGPVKPEHRENDRVHLFTFCRNLTSDRFRYSERAGNKNRKIPQVRQPQAYILLNDNWDNNRIAMPEKSRNERCRVDLLLL